MVVDTNPQTIGNFTQSNMKQRRNTHYAYFCIEQSTHNFSKVRMLLLPRVHIINFEQHHTNSCTVIKYNHYICVNI